MALTQENRLIAIDTPLGADVLLLRGVTGHEAISRLFSFELDLLSTDPEIKFDQIIGQSVTIRIRLRGDKERFLNGVISRFMQTGSDAGLANYRATMVPKLWLLTRTADCRIFQNKKIPDIIQEVIKENGITDIKAVLKGTYEPHDYCVQYRETDFNFVSRLMEQYGLFYFFEHEEKKHTLVLSDDLSAHKPCPEQAEVSWNPQGGDSFDEDVITNLQWEETFRFGKYAVTDYNFETPSTSLTAEVVTKTKVGGNDKFEIFDYPGEYGKKADGDGIAKIRMEEEEAKYKVISGSGGVRVFTTGYKFTLQDYVRKEINGEYLLTQVQHAASVGNTYEARGGGGGNQDEYSNSFTCIPAKTPFRAPQVTPKPMVQGPQTAVVVGKSGEEIWTDKYGRVKVQFHWDRYGEKNEVSSCWVRVSQNWAGKKWGAMFIPRIGQEVIVEFMEGDPDRPIVTGRVYNAEQTVPYDLPANQTMSTVKSNSSKGGEGFNELRFEDKKGEEQIFIHGEKDEDVRIKNDAKEWIGNERHLIIKKDQLESVEGDKHSSIKGDWLEKIEGDHGESVKGEHLLMIDGNDHLTVKGDQKVKIDGDVNLKSGMNLNQEAGMKISIKSGQDFHGKAGMNFSMDAGMAVHIKGGMTVVIEGGMQISLKAGPSFVDIGPAGVAISGPMVMINSGGAAGSGSGSSPTAPATPEAPDLPKVPKEAGVAKAGEKTEAPKPPEKPTASSPSAQVMKQAAKDGTPFCEKCEAARRQQEAAATT